VQLKKKTLKPIPKEADEQKAFCRWLDLKKICYQGSMMGSFLHPATYNRAKLMGCKSGFPDIMVFDKPPLAHPSHNYIGIAIELKRIKGGIISEEQYTWHNALILRKWLVKVCYGADEAIEFMKSLGF